MPFTITPQVPAGSLKLRLDLATEDQYEGRTPTPAEVAAYVPSAKFTVNAVSGAVRIAAGADATLTDKVTRTFAGLRVGTKYELFFQVRGSGAAQVWKVVAGSATKTFTPSLTATPESVYVSFTATATTHTVAFSTNTVPTGATSLLLSWLLFTLDGSVVDSLTRSDFNGTRPVRPPAGGFDLGGGALNHEDYENALSGIVAYTALVRHAGGTTEVLTASIDVTGKWSASFVAPPMLPRLGTTARIVETYEATSATSSVVHQVIGRPDPIIRLGVQRLRSGTMTIWAQDYAHAVDIVKTAGRGQVLQWRQPDHPGLDMYFVAGDTSIRPHDERTSVRRWSVTFPFTEVVAPVGNQLGTNAWNMESSTARNATFFDSLNEFATFMDLLIGPSSAPL